MTQEDIHIYIYIYIYIFKNMNAIQICIYMYCIFKLIYYIYIQYCYSILYNMYVVRLFTLPMEQFSHLLPATVLHVIVPAI